MTTVLLVDDEIDMRVLIRLTIEMANNGLRVVGEACDGVEALRMWRELNGPPVPHVVILDNRMPRLSGLEVAEQILSERPDQRIVLYTTTLDERLLREARRVGITRCLSNTDASRHVDVVSQVADSP